MRKHDTLAADFTDTYKPTGFYGIVYALVVR
jgi:hypothetical protein